jgi:hypothetical protein
LGIEAWASTHPAVQRRPTHGDRDGGAAGQGTLARTMVRHALR